MDEITIYGTQWCGDCRRAKQFLRERKVPFKEVNIDEVPEAEELVIRVNNGLRKIPTIEVAGRYFASSPFDPYQLSDELKIPLNPTPAG
ncbi:MAG: glutaredoxin family protein [Candidatus Acidiferrales bacterium]|jgi:glutaredoxin